MGMRHRHCDVLVTQERSKILPPTRKPPLRFLGRWPALAAARCSARYAGLAQQWSRRALLSDRGPPELRVWFRARV